MHYNQRVSRFTTFGALLLFLAMSATSVQKAVAKEFDLTGTWEGYAVCEELKGGHFTFDTFPDPLSISHRGDRIRISAFGILYEGVTQTIHGSQLRGEALVKACGGIPETETVRIRQVVTNQQGLDELVADTVFGSDDFFPGQRTFGTCKWFYRRTSSDDPLVRSCRH